MFSTINIWITKLVINNRYNHKANTGEVRYSESR